MQYRNDIDGLRAVAILPVVLYHAGIPGFSGGFVGVDVFFVISGFLITGLLHEDLRRGQLSLAGFYERRIRRILPALFVVVGAVCIAGYAILLPSDLEATAYSCIAAIFFVANFYFQSKAGYFDSSADTRPLWHAWSLSVEEQFYIVFPLLLMGLWRFRRRWTAHVLFVVFAVSFVAASYETVAHAKAAFYMTPLRMWELLAGSLVVLYAPQRNVAHVPRNLADAVALLLIVVPAVAYDPGVTFPGLAALPPVAGTAWLLGQRGGEPTLVRRLLATGPMRYFGLISYSLYLWHWPVIVFAEYYVFPGQIGIAFKLALVAVSIALATASWAFVERPFRRPKAGISRLFAFGAAAAVAIGLAVPSLAFVVTRGAPGRFPSVARWDAYRADYNPRRRGCLARTDHRYAVGRKCLYGDTAVPPAYAIWGDSSSAELAMALGDRLKPLHRSILQISYAGCPPAMNFESFGGCVERNNQAMALIANDMTIQNVILTTLYVTYENDRGRSWTAEAFEKGLRATVERLVAAKKKVWIVYPFPTQPFDAPRAVALYALRGQDPHRFRIPMAAFEAENRRATAFLDSLLGRSVKKIDLVPALCDRTWCSIVAGEKLLYSDDAHLSLTGAYFVVRMFDPVVADAGRLVSDKAVR